MRGWMAGALVLAAIAGCGGTSGNEGDAGHTSGNDGGGGVDAFVGGHQDAGPGVDGGCIPTYEICGDFMDQDCNGRDVGCGDNDHDGFEACRPPSPDFTMCDCDDTSAQTYPSRGTLPGAAEACDGRDNDCDMRIDESAQCCAGCASLGAETSRADVCTADGQCDCSTEPGIAPCAAGQTCCGGGCFDLQNDFAHCGSCTSGCMGSADHCANAECMCGSGSSCDGTGVCTGGTCG
ncbi:MAG: MopE-related protein [Sandaracinus sp.]